MTEESHAGPGYFWHGNPRAKATSNCLCFWVEYFVKRTDTYATYKAALSTGIVFQSSYILQRNIAFSCTFKCSVSLLKHNFFSPSCIHIVSLFLLFIISLHKHWITICLFRFNIEHILRNFSWTVLLSFLTTQFCNWLVTVVGYKMYFNHYVKLQLALYFHIVYIDISTILSTYKNFNSAKQMLPIN